MLYRLGDTAWGGPPAGATARREKERIQTHGEGEKKARPPQRKKGGWATAGQTGEEQRGKQAAGRGGNLFRKMDCMAQGNKI
ncbi:MAG: hypothetical protein ACOX0U_08445 [Oscillospiraceae bacterium]